jgi:hypothetical protein
MVRTGQSPAPCTRRSTSASTSGSHPTPGVLLPGTLASPRAGLTPAGCRELVARLRRGALLSMLLGARATGRTFLRNQPCRWVQSGKRLSTLRRPASSPARPRLPAGQGDPALERVAGRALCRRRLRRGAAVVWGGAAAAVRSGRLRGHNWARYGPGSRSSPGAATRTRPPDRAAGLRVDGQTQGGAGLEHLTIDL